MEIRKEIPELFGLVKTMLIEEFDRRYVTVTQAASVVDTTVIVVVGFQRCGLMQYKEFSYMKPPEFRGDRDLIIALIWISDVEGCFYTCSCPEDQKLKFVLNLLC